MPYDLLLDTWNTGDTVFIVALAISFLVTLYTLTLIHRKMRLIESEILAMRKDQSVISEELEMLARLGGDQQKNK